MNAMIEKLKQFSAAEEFLAYFNIPWDETVVNVNRLHILKRFYQYLHQERHLSTKTADVLFIVYHDALKRAYHDFVRSDAATEKVFKVFQDAEAKSFSLEKLKSTLPGTSQGLVNE